ncbi:Coiled-coil domain-containing protein 42-like [Holothuria leucospilota]|uniref:Coiled-coil domain-containing protein 42-like n=1 Tax=Holothuria leucospilota TaxID=206669 RepID=A0A9Q1CI51_HOLLE|nr:Coiled-coil domain-containing protein 42-like [Holothuria leucospilota]
MASTRRALPAPKGNMSYKLELDEPKKNVFVTQLGDYTRNEEDEEVVPEDVNKYPIVKESAAQLIETGLNTTQKTLLLKREVEVEQVTDELRVKRADFQRRMEACEKRRAELQRRQQEMKERVKKFEKFIDETEAKRRRAIHKYQTELKLKEQKEIELEQLLAQLEELKERHNLLERRIQRYKKFEEYLMKVLDHIPENYLEVNDSMLRAIMDRHRTLAATNSSLVDRVQDLYDGVESATKKLNNLKTDHIQKKLVINKQLAELQNIQEERTDMNTQLEEMFFSDMTAFRDQNEILGRIKMAINNVSEKCIKSHDPPLSSMNFEEKLTLIMNFVVDKIAVERMARLGFDEESSIADPREARRKSVTSSKS